MLFGERDHRVISVAEEGDPDLELAGILAKREDIEGLAYPNLDTRFFHDFPLERLLWRLFMVDAPADGLPDTRQMIILVTALHNEDFSCCIPDNPFYCEIKLHPEAINGLFRPFQYSILDFPVTMMYTGMVCCYFQPAS